MFILVILFILFILFILWGKIILSDIKQGYVLFKITFMDIFLFIIVIHNIVTSEIVLQYCIYFVFNIILGPFPPKKSYPYTKIAVMAKILKFNITLSILVKLTCFFIDPTVRLMGVMML